MDAGPPQPEGDAEPGTTEPTTAAQPLHHNTSPNTTTITTVTQQQQDYDTVMPQQTEASTDHSDEGPSATNDSHMSEPHRALQAARKPLTDRYGSFLVDADTCLQDARQRLQTALQQTMQLRQAFTRRVYDKYRVCLTIPEDRTPHIQQQPATMYSKIVAEQAALKEEKELEKRTLPEELWYYSPGLFLVILPGQETSDPKVAAAYPERQLPGQRCKSISQASAAAGDAVVQRTMRAAAVRMERQQLKPTSALAEVNGNAMAALTRHGIPNNMTSDLASLKTAITSNSNKKRKHSEIAYTGAPSQDKQVTPNRTRPPGASLSISSLLSLAPLADELLGDANPHPSAATKALIAKTSMVKTTQQRLKHPHPESLGGRRRASQSSGSKEPFLQAYLALTLPPLPVTKDKAERKVLPVIPKAATDRATRAVSQVLGLFQQQSNGLTKIQLQLGLHKLKRDWECSKTLTSESKTENSADGGGTGPADPQLPPPPRPVSDEPPPDSLIDPLLTYSVLDALGLFVAGNEKQEPESVSVSVLELEQSFQDMRQLKTLHEFVQDPESKQKTLMQQFQSTLRHDRQSSDQTELALPKEVASSNIPAMNLRGGGDEDSTSLDQHSHQDSSTAGPGPDQGQEKKVAVRTGSKRKYSDVATAGNKDQPISHQKRSDPGHSVVEHQPTMPGMTLTFHGQQLQDAYNMALPQFGIQHPVAPVIPGGIHAGYNQFPAQLHPNHSIAPSLTTLKPQGPPQQAQDGGQAHQQVGQVIGALFGSTVHPTVFNGIPQQPVSLDLHLPGNTNMSQHQKKSSGIQTSDLPNLPSTMSSSKMKVNQEASESDRPQARKSSADSGLQFIEPEKPGLLPQKDADLIRQGKLDQTDIFSKTPEVQGAALEYLLAFGRSVPIPKTFVASLAKERLSTQGFKNLSRQGFPNLARGLVLASIVWVWVHHEEQFQQAFTKSGRVDVDIDCKWLIQATVDTGVRALALTIAQQLKAGVGPFFDIIETKKSGGSQKHAGGVGAADQASSKSTHDFDVWVAVTVQKALNERLGFSSWANKALPHFQKHLEYLDELRLCALLTKAQERTLLANIVARKATMNESFASAYASSIVRAGEILGQDKLFEAVQDTETATCSMMPHDILTGEGDAWEDPCKPELGYTRGLLGTDLMRRAHARAMIHKVLKKLQDKNHIRGGVSDFGPYVDPNAAASTPTVQVKNDSSMSPRIDTKKRRPSLAELTVPPGTGSAQARSWSQYEPKHTCEPVFWPSNRVENTPYGLHRRGEIVRSLSVSFSSRSGEPRSAKKSKKAVDAALSPSFSSDPTVPDENTTAESDNDEAMPRSTQEINWADVAGIFQKVEVPRSRKVEDAAVAASKSIMAPNFQLIETVALDEDESETEEDLTDEIVLEKHQVILDAMKEKIAQYFEKRKEQQQDRRRKNASQKNAKSK